MSRLGVLVMAYGGPDSLADVEPYLLDIRGGRPTPQALVEEIRERYRKIGGRSPRRELTARQALALLADAYKKLCAGNVIDCTMQVQVARTLFVSG